MSVQNAPRLLGQPRLVELEVDAVEDKGDLIVGLVRRNAAVGLAACWPILGDHRSLPGHRTFGELLHIRLRCRLLLRHGRRGRRGLLLAGASHDGEENHAGNSQQDRW